MKYSLISFWPGFNNDNNWFTNNYCRNHDLTINYEESKFIIIAPFIKNNELEIIEKINTIKILYITEPIEIMNEFNLMFNISNENKFNIIIGCINHDPLNNRFKFPLYMYSFDYNNIDIYNNSNNYVKNCNIDSKKFCCLINTHDRYNTRKPIYNLLKNIDHIECPSLLFNNCSNQELNNLGNFEYIKKFKFNICSENSITKIKGYITEKLLNCCLGGAIPIYCGWFDEIDEKIFNKNRILFYNPSDNNSLENLYNKVFYLINNKDEFIKFYSQDIFCNTAYDTIKNLEKDLTNMFDGL
jgi:hypothetical protein